MNETTKAAKQLASLLRSLSSLPDALDKLGRAEEYEKELSGKTAILAAQLNDATGKLEAAKTELGHVQKDIAASREAHRVYAESERSRVKELGDGLLVEARTKAQAVEAEAEAKRVKADADLALSRIALSALKKETDDERAKLAGIKAELTRIRAMA